MNVSTPRLKILYVAYPLLPLSDESAGGAEQMLWTVEREMARRGHETVVAACEQSQVSGELLPTGKAATGTDQLEQREAEHTSRILGFLDECRQFGDSCDLVHDKSGHFWRHAAAVSLPVLSTLHLPRTFYPQELFASGPPNLFFNCVSQAQAETFTDLATMLGVVRNGIAVERFPLTCDKDDYLLWLGRVCEEKGTHIAIEVARRAGLPLIIAGQVYPFSYHEQYYNREIRPYLDGKHVRFVETPTFAAKIELLRHARALLVPSLAPETSSLVAMEAMACGTPVIGFRRGGIPEVVADSVTGFVVDSAERMAEAILQAGRIDPHACRDHVARNYSTARMADDYERLYEVLRTSGSELRKAA